MLVYRLEKQDMTVTLTDAPDSGPLVELALGSEARTFPLAEFTDFWLTMIEVGRQATSSYLDALADSARRRNRRSR
jgi:hypothetical protein